MKIHPDNFGGIRDGITLGCFSITDGSGTTAVFSNWGARLLQLVTPDKKGEPGDVVLGYDSLVGYLHGHTEMGALIGRVANRIANGRFELDGIPYQLAQNNGVNHLHGGEVGVMRRVFEVIQHDSESVGFQTVLAHGEDGFPGMVRLRVVYSLCGGALRMEITAHTDKPTPISLCNHAYFALGPESSIEDNILRLRASAYTPVREGLIPTGEIAPVAGTPFDFTTPKRIGDDIGADHPQIRIAGGYDHNFVLDKPSTAALASSNAPANPVETLAAELFAPSSGRILRVYTTEPGIQFYSGNFLGKNPECGRRPLTWRAGLCLETQHFPDSVNQPEFPSSILRPGQQYYSATTYAFSTGDEL